MTSPVLKKTIYTALRAIDSLKIIFAPFLPFSSEKLNTFIGFDKPIFGQQVLETINDGLGEHTVLRYLPDQASGDWTPSQLMSGQAIHKPTPLFRKLDPDIINQERSRMG
jgi:methionyl-tRNA synthetase